MKRKLSTSDCYEPLKIVILTLLQLSEQLLSVLRVYQYFFVHMCLFKVLLLFNYFLGYNLLPLFIESYYIKLKAKERCEWMAIDDVFFSPNCFSPGNDNIKSSNNMINKTYTEDLFNTHVLHFLKRMPLYPL